MFLQCFLGVLGTKNLNHATARQICLSVYPQATAPKLWY